MLGKYDQPFGNYEHFSHRIMPRYFKSRVKGQAYLPHVGNQYGVLISTTTGSRRYSFVYK